MFTNASNAQMYKCFLSFRHVLANKGLLSRTSHNEVFYLGVARDSILRLNAEKKEVSLLVVCSRARVRVCMYV